MASISGLVKRRRGPLQVIWPTEMEIYVLQSHDSYSKMSRTRTRHTISSVDQFLPTLAQIITAEIFT